MLRSSHSDHQQDEPLSVGRGIAVEVQLENDDVHGRLAHEGEQPTAGVSSDDALQLGHPNAPRLRRSRLL
jgi:hypothetical protein